MKRPTVRTRPIVEGYERQWVRCPECGWTGYYDFIPYSLGNPIKWLGCGHGAGVRFADFCEYLTEADVLKTYDIVTVGESVPAA